MSEYKYPWQQREANRKREKKDIYPRPVHEAKKQDKKTAPISKIAESSKADEALHQKLKRKYLKDHPFCTCGRPGCPKDSDPKQPATDIHHTKGRGRYLNVVAFFKAVARACHTWIGENTEEATALGLIVSRLNYGGNDMREATYIGIEHEELTGQDCVVVDDKAKPGCFKIQMFGQFAWITGVDGVELKFLGD